VNTSSNPTGASGAGNGPGAGSAGPVISAHTPDQAAEIAVHGTEQVRERGWWTGRAGLLFPLILAALATYMLVGQLTMKVAEDADKPGPQFMPGLIITALYIIAVLIAVDIIRRPQLPEMAALTDPEEVGRVHAWYSDWPRLAWAVGGCLAFAVLLVPVGWILAAALLFWCIARSMGSTRVLFDISLALLFSSAVYLIFGVLLAVDLPSGLIFGGGR
jgi:putative tricarboxylic transport membrane protein